MARNVLFLLFSLAFVFACSRAEKGTAELGANPYLLKAGKYVPYQEKSVDTSLFLKSAYLQVKGEYVEAGAPKYITERKNYHLASRPSFVSTQAEKVSTGDLAKAKFVPAQGESRSASWPKWTSAKLAYNNDNRFHFSYLDVEQGLRMAGVRRLLEDKQGNIWIGTDDGLSVWDGGGFIHFTEAEGLSDNTVLSLLEDRLGRIWIGTENGGLNIWDGEKFTYFTKASGLSGNSISSLLEDREGKVWIGTSDGGLSVWEPNTSDARQADEFLHYGKAQGLSGVSVSSLLEDREGRVWIGTFDGGLSLWDKSNFIHYTKTEGLRDNTVTSLLETNDGKIWIGTDDGISVWDTNDDQAGFFDYTEKEGLPDNTVIGLLQDRRGDVWIGMDEALSVWDGKGFTHYSQAEGLKGKSVSSLLEDRYGKIWIGSREAGLSIWNSLGFTRYTAKEELNGNIVRSLLESRDGKIWIGTGDGLNVWDGRGFSQFTEEEGLTDNMILSLLEDRRGNVWIGTDDGLNVWDGRGFIHYTEEPGFANHSILSLLEDRDGKIWIGTDQNGLKVWDGVGFTEYTKAEGFSNYPITSLLEDREGKIWIGLQNGGVNVWDFAESGRFTSYTEIEGLSNNWVTSLLEDEKGGVWIGTMNGLNYWDGKGFTHYTETEGLTHNALSGLFQDEQGDIWIESRRGLNKLSFEEKSGDWFLQTFLSPDKLGGTSFFSILVDQKQRLWLGGAQGLKKMDLNLEQTDTSRPTLAIRDLQPFFNFVDWRETLKGVQSGKKPLLGKQKLPMAKINFDSVKAFSNLPHEPSFPYNINQFNFRWSAKYARPYKLQYSYFLKGKDKIWSPLLPDNKVAYQDLNPGNYTFQVRTIGGNGRSSDIAAYSFKIRPPWWLSLAAKIGYFLAAAAFLYAFYYWRAREQLKKLALREKELAQERQLTERLQQVDKLKDQFLANTSHELRTPLQGIIGLSESLFDQIEKDPPEKQREDLSMIISSGKRLNSLVDDLLDFSKLKNFDLELNPQLLNLHVLTEIVLKNNAPLIRAKNLELINAIPPDMPAVEADENRLQQILFNLIGNAVKFTESGYVKVGIKTTNSGDLTAENGTGKRMVQVFVEDTGIGIPENKQETIFREFEQADASISREFVGTGLGLSISKRLVELHGGRMWLESEIGRGSTFFFTLPLSKEKVAAVNPNAIVSRPDYEASIAANGKMLKTGTLRPEKAGRIHILTVDDEPVNQQVLKNHLSSKQYQITPALNGAEALQLLEENQNFDLVILDVMMPRMSGYEVCRKIREKYLPSELPVIMVTAKNQVQDLVQGLTLGANDYLAKPFSKEEFLARVKTQLDLHRINAVTGKFVPNEFLRYIGRERITEVMLGDHAQREVTVLFSDIRDYTTLAESMSPQDNFKFVNAFNGRMGPVIQQNNGFVNQYLGDGIMAIFPEKPREALQAAVGMQKALGIYNEKRISDKRRPLEMGVGLHAGSLIMGVIGDQNRMDAATIADTVNTASRIEGLTKYYGASILLSEDVLQKQLAQDGRNLQDSFHLRRLGKVQVKGKKEPVAIYECFDGDAPEVASKKQQTIPDFEKGLAHFYAREFPEATGFFNKVLKTNPEDRVARLFLHQASRYTYEGAPEGWDGVERMRIK